MLKKIGILAAALIVLAVALTGCGGGENPGMAPEQQQDGAPAPSAAPGSSTAPSTGSGN